MSDHHGDSLEGSSRSRRRGVTQALNPPGLLLFSPLGTPARMTFHPLAEDETVLGRTPDCTVRLNDDKVSRRHARIVSEAGGQCRLEDLDSANGVFVGGQQVKEAALGGGELLRLGNALLRFLRTGPAQVQTQHAAHTRGMVSGPSLDGLRGLLDRGASSNLSFLVVGEPGTGKELVARRLHEAGRRCDGPFVPVDCLTISDSQLFGRVDDTGAAEASPGRIRQADQGTLFLDAIDALSPASQARLQGVLMEHQVRPLGGARAYTAVVRVVSATCRDLAAMVARQTFRADLLGRLAEVVVQLPPLRERFEDIPLLVRHFLAEHAAAAGQGDKAPPGESGEASPLPPRVPVDVLEQLCLRAWPGNVRELAEAVHRALELADGAPELTEAHFAGVGVGPETTDDHVDPEAQELIEALRRHDGDTVAAAEALGISRSELYTRAQKHKIVAAHYKVI